MCLHVMPAAGSCPPTPAPTPWQCENHTGITGPEFPGLKLPNGELPSASAGECDSFHARCAGTDASPTWYAPYQEHELAAYLKALDCNPASCENDPE